MAAAILCLLAASAGGTTQGLAGQRPSTSTPFASALADRQASMADKLAALDPDACWSRDEHERGVALVLEGGRVWEKGCVSVTVVEESVLTAARAEAISGRTGVAGVVEGARYSAAALSFVLHSRSPLVPTLRGDVRWFKVGEHEWYGGGLDLTPSYLFEEDAAHFHTCLRQLCERDGSGTETYRRFKQLCDQYFYLPARAEHRGVGGIFYDDLSEPWAPTFSLALLDAAVDEHGPYLPIVERRQPLKYTPEQRQWQLLRRGRYVEFNLLYGTRAREVERGVALGGQDGRGAVDLVLPPPRAGTRACEALGNARAQALPGRQAPPLSLSPHVVCETCHPSPALSPLLRAPSLPCIPRAADRGVRFGLTPESVERVLVSSPPLVAWHFRADPEPGTPEALTMAVLRKPREWA
jgi:coproporphyrinogen III oxidase